MEFHARELKLVDCWKKLSLVENLPPAPRTVKLGFPNGANLLCKTSPRSTPGLHHRNSAFFPQSLSPFRSILAPCKQYSMRCARDAARNDWKVEAQNGRFAQGILTNARVDIRGLRHFLSNTKSLCLVRRSNRRSKGLATDRKHGEKACKIIPPCGFFYGSPINRAGTPAEDNHMTF